MAKTPTPTEIAVNEPSRSGGVAPGRFPHLSSHKLRRRAANGLGELGAEFDRINRMMRVEPPDYDKPAPRHVITVYDVTRGLGLDNATEQKVWKLVGEPNVKFDRKSGTQPLLRVQGAFVEWLRTQRHIDSDLRQELTRRARAWWKRTYPTDDAREARVRFTVGKSQLESPELQKAAGHNRDKRAAKPKRAKKSMAKGGPHKYTSKRWSGGKWVYNYDEPTPHKPTKISDVKAGQTIQLYAYGDNGPRPGLEWKVTGRNDAGHLKLTHPTWGAHYLEDHKGSFTLWSEEDGEPRDLPGKFTVKKSEQTHTAKASRLGIPKSYSKRPRLEW